MSTVHAFVIALLGAESTGKTTLAAALGAELAREGHRVAVVDEYLREFCDRHGRTPRSDEQRGIADTQSARIEAAARTHEIVVADTSALMIAVYSDQVFGDTGLYAHAEQAHVRGCDLTLLTATDLPWQADGLQRDGPQVREIAIVFGTGDARLAAALASVHRALTPPVAEAAGDGRWHWHCERCGDPNCERRVRLLPV